MKSQWLPSYSLVVSKEKVYGLEEFVLLSSPSTYSSTLLTPTLSEALVVTIAVPDTLWPVLKFVIETVGGILSEAFVARFAA